MPIDLQSQWKVLREQGEHLTNIHNDPKQPPADSSPATPGSRSACGMSGSQPSSTSYDDCATKSDEPQAAGGGLPELFARANHGEPAALDELRTLLDARPEIWQKVGNLAQHTRLTTIRAISAGDRLLEDSLLRKADALQVQLAGEQPTALERLAVEGVVACWLQLQHADLLAARAMGSLPEAKFWNQKQDQSHRRYLAAIKQLTAIRALVPQMQSAPDQADKGHTLKVVAADVDKPSHPDLATA